MGRLEDALRRRIASGGKCLVPYITGGYPGWRDAVRAAAANGADAIEIGLPFSDPVMDGPVIQQASQAALDDGATPITILDGVRQLDVDVPLVVMAAGKPNPAFGAVADEYQKYWIEQSRELARKSSRGRFVLAEKATHYLYLDEPELVAQTILAVVSEARAK